jgi:hypothetical protein
MWVSEQTKEKSVTSPASAQASRGSRVFTGRFSTILAMKISLDVPLANKR